jgi:acyl carrier protein
VRPHLFPDEAHVSNHDESGVAVQIVGFDRFLEILRAEFELDSTPLDRETFFVEDLDFDSFEFLRLVLVVEELAPELEIPEELALEELTVGGLYDFYAVNSTKL